VNLIAFLYPLAVALTIFTNFTGAVRVQSQAAASAFAAESLLCHFSAEE
jgi:hypothetical protein